MLIHNQNKMAYQITLTFEEKKELFTRIKTEKRVKIHRRLKSIEYKIRGINNQDIATALDVRPETITQWLSLFANEGFKGLCHLKYEGRRPGKLAPHKEAIKAYIKEKAPSTLAQLNDWLKSTYGLTMDETWLSRYCKKNSLFPVKKQSLSQVRLPK